MGISYIRDIWQRQFQSIWLLGKLCAKGGKAVKPSYDRAGAWLAGSKFSLIGLKNRNSTQVISNFKSSTNANFVKPNLHKRVISGERSILPAQV